MNKEIKCDKKKINFVYICIDVLLLLFKKIFKNVIFNGEV